MLRRAAVVALLAPVVACTHFTPYYRAGQARMVDAAKPAAIDHRVILIGDTGAPRPTGEPVLELLARRVRLIPERTTAVFLGDVVYERGMPEPISTVEKPLDAAADVMDVVLPDLLASRQEAERQMRAQLAVVAETKARAVFVAGNHDWDQFEVGGWERILALEQFIRNEAAAQGANVALTPSGGCPGPVAVPAGRRATVVAIDTQWWIETRKDGKPTPDRNPTNCLWVTEDAVQAQLVKELAKAKREDRWAIVAAHHPLETKGPHGGFVDVRTHLFPLRIIRHYIPFYLEWIPIPIFGSAVVWYRQCCSPSVQDMGSRASSVGSNARTIFAHSNPLQSGFMEIDFLTDGSARLAVWETDAERPDGVEVFSMLLAKRKP